MSFNLAKTLTVKKSRRDRIKFNRIVLTKRQKAELRAIYLRTVYYWQEVYADQILQELPTTDSIEGAENEFDRAEKGAGVLIRVLVADLENWFTKTIGWHTEKWQEDVKNKTGTDIKGFTKDLTKDEKVKALIKANTSLIKDISSTARKSVEYAVYEVFTGRSTRTEATKQINKALRSTVKRATNIANDQANKLNARLNRERNEEAEIDWYEWVHSGKTNFRKDHKARHGKLFRWDDPPSGGHPGEEINCGCTSKAVLMIDGERIN